MTTNKNCLTSRECARIYMCVFAIDIFGVQCCPFTGMRCKSDVNEPAQYYFRYKIVYNTEEDFDSLVPVYSSIFSASSTTAANCEVEYNAPRCTELGLPTSEYASGACRGGTNSTIEFSWMAQSLHSFQWQLRNPFNHLCSGVWHKRGYGNSVRTR